MSAYNKLFAAIIATLVSRWLLRYCGVSVQELGVSADLQDLVSLLIDSSVAVFNGFWVWLLPNKAVK